MSTSDGEELSGEQEDPAHLIELINTAGSQISPSHVSSQPQASFLQPTDVSFQELQELLETLRHEFSTPLMVIEGYTTTLLARRRRLTRREQDEFLQIIQQAGKRLGKLTEQIFEVARLEAGIIQLSLSQVDLSTVARHAIKEVERRVPEVLRDHFTFTLQCRDVVGNPVQELPLVHGDIQRLQQVLLHLLENAVRYSPNGGRIDVIARPVPQAGDASREGQSDDPSSYVELCICDFGIGIPEEHRARIFDPFYRIDSNLTRESYGLGLGLTVCRHLVTLHQGRIWAESCPDGGSAFHVWLPLQGPNSPR